MGVYKSYTKLTNVCIKIFHGCHQIREIKEIREFCIQSGKIRGERKIFQKSTRIMEVLNLFCT